MEIKFCLQKEKNDFFTFYFPIFHLFPLWSVLFIIFYLLWDEFALLFLFFLREGKKMSKGEEERGEEKEGG